MYSECGFYHFRAVVMHARFSLLAVAAFLVSRNMPTARGTVGIIHQSIIESINQNVYALYKIVEEGL